MGKIHDYLDGKKTYISGAGFVLFGIAECILAYTNPVMGTSMIEGGQHILLGLGIIGGRSAINKLSGTNAILPQAVDNTLDTIETVEDVTDKVTAAVKKAKKEPKTKEEVKLTQTSSPNVSKSTEKTVPVVQKKGKIKLGDLDFKSND